MHIQAPNLSSICSTARNVAVPSLLTKREEGITSQPWDHHEVAIMEKCGQLDWDGVASSFGGFGMILIRFGGKGGREKKKFK